MASSFFYGTSKDPSEMYGSTVRVLVTYVRELLVVLCISIRRFVFDFLRFGTKRLCGSVRAWRMNILCGNAGIGDMAV